MTVQNKALRSRVEEIFKSQVTIDQDELLRVIEAPDEEILLMLKNLMQEGKIAYNIDWELDGRGKQYATGVSEEER